VRPRRWLALFALALVVAACASAPTQDTGRPDEVPPSTILRDAFFASAVGAGGSTYSTQDTPWTRAKRFTSADERVYFVTVFNPMHSARVRGVLYRPDGRQHGTWEREYTPRAGGVGTWASQSRWWAMSGLRAYPGEWRLELWIDEQPMGRYYFMLGEAAARVRSGWAADSRTGCQVWNERPEPDETVTWSGACSPNGLAVGYGVEEFRFGDKTSRYEGEFLDGKKHGTGTKTWATGNRYVGAWLEGRAHGQGVFTMTGGRFEGDWRDGCFRDGDRRAAVGRPLSECP
jgi:hypothetical protein